MPLYEYRCAGCGKRFELLQKFSDPPEAPCPACGGRGERQLSPPALRFKGSGWYVTDYARKPTPAEKSESQPAEAGPAGGASSSDGERPAAARPKQSAGAGSESAPARKESE